MAKSPIDYTSFEDAVVATLPPPLRLVFQHYDPLRAEDGLVLVVPPGDATALALTHPRAEGESRGVAPSDGLGLIPNDLDEQVIGELVARAGQRHLFVHVVAEPDQSTDRLPMEPEALRACVAALPPNAVADVVAPSTLLNDSMVAPFPRLLLTKGNDVPRHHIRGRRRVGPASF